jgi:Na+/phosphate symporter
MVLIIGLWLLLMLEIFRFVMSVRGGIRSARAVTTSKLSANMAGCLVVFAFSCIFAATIGILIAAVVTLTDLQ